MRGRIGVFGGSFDPIHLGHLIVAEHALEQLGLERLLFLPAARSPHKPDRQPAPDEDRLAMIDLAIAGQPAFGISRVDLDRPPPSYTVDSLELVRGELEQAGGAGEASELYLVLGADSLAGFPRWHRPEAILHASRLAVFGRPGAPLDLAALQAELPGLAHRLDLLDGPLVGISATDIRERRAHGRSIRYLVPEAVRGYIVEHGLYRTAMASEVG